MKKKIKEIIEIRGFLFWPTLYLILFIVLIFVKTVKAEDKPNIYGEPVEFESTAYCWTGNPTRSGVYPLEGRTIAVDPKIIPLGSTVIVYTEDMELMGIYIAEDTGGAIKNRIIDIYMDKRNDCIQWGRQKVFVQVVQAEG